MDIVEISIIIFIFTLLFIIFAYIKTNQNIGIWIILMILFSIVLGGVTNSHDYNNESMHPSFLIGKFSKYNN